MSTNEDQALAKMLAPFAPNEIGRLPKPTKAQTDAVKTDYRAGVRCDECGAWHHPKVAHLDYVGHAAITKRLLEVDPHWHWEPLAFDDAGLPRLDEHGGLWIKLTVCGMTRLGYGSADKGGSEGDRIKELIGDGIRNSAMRFGAALGLWHKGDLFAVEELPDKADEGQKDDGLADFEADHLEPMRAAAMQGSKALAEAFASLPNTPQKRPFWTAHQGPLKAAASQADKVSG